MSFLRANERLSGSGPLKAAAIARIPGPISAVVGPDLIPLLCFRVTLNSVEEGRVMPEAN